MNRLPSCCALTTWSRPIEQIETVVQRCHSRQSFIPWPLRTPPPFFLPSFLPSFQIETVDDVCYFSLLYKLIVSIHTVALRGTVYCPPVSQYNYNKYLRLCRGVSFLTGVRPWPQPEIHIPLPSFLPFFLSLCTICFCVHP